MDYVLIDQDEVLYLPNFGAAIVSVRPGKLRASGPASLGGKKLCVVGDEDSARVEGCTYVTATYSSPGMGKLEISSLGRDQQAATSRSGGKAVLLVGSGFTATFTVQTPAQQPPPGPGSPVPDPTPRYSGQGRFLTFNTKFRGS